MDENNKITNLITWADFAKVDFRVGQITEIVKVEGSDKLMRMVVDFGADIGKRIVFSGIYQWYKPEDLLNKKTVFVINVIPKKIMGEESSAMIFGAGDEAHTNMSILLLDKDMENGTKVF